MNELVQVIQNLRGMLRFLLRSERVTIASVSPLTVTLRNGTTVPGVPVSGLTYTAGGHGIALMAERSQPLVLPTT